MPQKDSLILVFLKISVVLPLAYAAISSLLYPNDWVSFLPSITERYIDPFLALTIISIIQMILSILILWGKKLFWPAGISALMLFSIVITNYDVRDIFFRDIGLAFAALALALFGNRD